MAQPLWKIVRQFLKKLKMELLHYLAIALLRKYPKDLKEGAWIFVYAYFPVIKRSKKPSVHQQINGQNVYIHAMEYYSALKRNDILTHAAT